MRSEMPWMEPKSPWSRIGPTALALAIIGVGVGGAVRIVRAQDGAPGVEKAQPPVSADVTVEPKDDDNEEAKDTDQAPTKKPNDAEQKALRKELESLLKERSKLDSRIADVSKKLGEPYRVEMRLGDGNARVFSVTPRIENRRLTPEQRKQADEAMKEAEKSLRDAQKGLSEEDRGHITDALREAEKALHDAFGQMDRSGQEYRWVVPNIPNVPIIIPRFDGKDSKPFFFKFDSRNPNFKSFAPDSPEFEKQMKEFSDRMEKWSKEFNDRMEKWQQEFESKLRDKYRDKAPDNKSDQKGGKTTGFSIRITAPSEDATASIVSPPSPAPPSQKTAPASPTSRPRSSQDAI